MDILKNLFRMQDLKYKNFHSALMPTVSPDLIIGIRVPQLRKFAKELAKTSVAEKFLSSLPHKYYEENNVHAFLIEQEKNFDRALELTEVFLPYIDNWATCDMFRPPVFKKHPEKLINFIYKWLDSDEIYTVRFAIGLLLSFYLDENFKPGYLERVSKIKSDEYYINMMVAWYFQTAIVKQFDAAIPYIKGRHLPKWVHNKAIQKCCESLRIDKNTKDYLKTLKIKD